MTVETITPCANCNKPTFARYGSVGWTEWEVCPSCGLAILNREIYADENTEPTLYGDEALDVFFCQMGGLKDIEKVEEHYSKYFSKDENISEDGSLYEYSEEEIAMMLSKRESLDYLQEGEPYILALARRILSTCEAGSSN